MPRQVTVAYVIKLQQYVPVIHMERASVTETVKIIINPYHLFGRGFFIPIFVGNKINI